MGAMTLRYPVLLTAPWITSAPPMSPPSSTPTEFCPCAVVELALPIVTLPLTAPVPGARQVQLAWTPDGTLLMAYNGWLHAWKPGETAWRAVAELEKLGLKGVTRLAVSPKGDRLAIVAQ